MMCDGGGRARAIEVRIAKVVEVGKGSEKREDTVTSETRYG